jgi:hypothetical protein
MDATLGVGVGAWPEPSGGFDLWLPVLAVGCLVLIRVIVGLKITPATAAAAVVAATLWAVLRDAVGVLPSIATLILVAILAGALVRRVAPGRD